jgi:hypothetical protein
MLASAGLPPILTLEKLSVWFNNPPQKLGETILKEEDDFRKEKWKKGKV